MQSQPSSPSVATGEPHDQQDPELWFEDGNVVIVAGNGAFRVHTGVLSRHSEIFRNMFSVPQPALPAASDIVDGRPVVHISDSAHDFKQLLHMLYDGVGFMPPDRPAAFHILAAITRLGHKYHVEWVLEEAKRHLRSIFPTSFQVWSDFKENEGPSSHLVDVASGSSMGNHPWIEALNLIQLIGATDMLPVAIYQCCQFPSVLFKGTTRIDGTPETLGLPTLQLCFNAYTRLIQRQSRLNAETFCVGPSESCRFQGGCGGGGNTDMQWIYNCWTSISPSTYLTGSPMSGRICRLIKKLEDGGEICDSCSAVLAERDRKGRRAVWRDLPSITGVQVDNWDRSMDNM